MASLEQKLKFATKHVTHRSGRPFDVSHVNRRWILDEFWRPASGWKWWPNEPGATCDKCLGYAGQIVEFTWDNPSTGPKHKATGCKGLDLHAIILQVLRLPRREGKTFNGAAHSLAEIFQDKNRSILNVAAAGKQNQKLFRDNYISPIEKNPALRAASEVSESYGSIYVPATKSRIDFVDTSHSSITGTGRTRIVIDEARDITNRVFMAVLPSFTDEGGMECPKGCFQAPTTHAPKKCPLCEQRMIPWFGRALVMSSAPLIDGDDNTAWFQELCESLESGPHPNCHYYNKTESSNPDVNKTALKALDDVLGKCPSLKELVQVELFNRPTRKGDSFLTRAQVEAVVDPQLTNQEGATGRCVGFLDTSVSKDLTSLVILEEVPSPPKDGKPYVPFELVRTARIDVWDPAQEVGGVIDPERIQAHLDYWMTFFPAMAELGVDVRLQPWAERLVIFSQRNRPWGRKIQPFRGQQAERIAAWDAFEQRVLAKTIRIQNHPTLIKELQGVRKVRRPDGREEVRDASRKVRHADIADSLANACYLAHQHSMTGRLKLADVEANTSNARTTVRSMLDNLYRPAVRGLTEDSF